MLNPNYGRKKVASNYNIGHGHGNNYFDLKGVRGIHELLINGYAVRFIPHYDLQQFTFPPTVDEFRMFNRDPRNMQEARVHLFEGASLVFFEYNEKAGQSFTFNYECKFILPVPEIASGLIHCISSEVYHTLTKEMRKKMPYIASDRNLNPPVKRSDIKDLKFVQFLDKQFAALKDLLPKDMLDSFDGTVGTGEADSTN